MGYPFIKYINPAWYFSLPSGGDHTYFPDYDHLPEEQQQMLELDLGYSSRTVAKWDAAYQAWSKGFIVEDTFPKLDELNITPTIGDHYRFLRRFFHPLWSLYVLGIRILSFKNPVTEFQAFWKQRKVPRLQLFQNVFDHYRDFATFESSLLLNAPRVSVIIPTLNRYLWLKDALHDLEQQDYKNFEVVVVDQSDPFQPEFYKQFALDLRIIQQEEKALWLARNTAVEQSKAPYLLLYDDDSRTGPDWISQHLKCLDYFGVPLSSGVSISKIGAKVPEHYRFFRWGDQVDTGNVMIRREVFRKTGLFDRQFERQRQGDGEFGLRAYLAGFKNISNPYAKRIHLKVGEGGLRQMGSWDSFRPIGWFAPRPVPSVLYLLRKYFGDKAAIYSLLTDVPRSILPYRYKRNNRMLLLGSFLVIPLLPLLLWQVIKSWRIATVMLREGAKIPVLK